LCRARPTNLSGSAITYGISFDVDNDRLIAGSSLSNGLGNRTGEAVTYRRDQSGNWSEDKRYADSNGKTGDLFGRNVALDGGSVFIANTDTLFIEPVE